MQMNSLVDNDSYNIYRYGTFYNPSSKQYPLIPISCHRCYKTYFNACIGWNTKNLCLECANTIDTLIMSGIISQGIAYNQPYVSTTVTSYSSPTNTIMPIATVPTISYASPITPIPPATIVSPIVSYTTTSNVPTMY